MFESFLHTHACNDMIMVFLCVETVVVCKLKHGKESFRELVRNPFDTSRCVSCPNALYHTELVEGLIIFSFLKFPTCLLFVEGGSSVGVRKCRVMEAYSTLLIHAFPLFVRLSHKR